MSNTDNNGTISFADVLQIVFIILKLCKVIDWSWWWVFSPLWISFILTFIYKMIYEVLKTNRY